jgi:penicillin-binding protein 2
VRIYEDLRGLQRRLSLIQASMVVAMALLVAYFWHLQVLRGKHYKELAENNRIRSVVIPAPRGAVFDRSGRILVENRSSFNIVMTAEHNADLQRSVERMAELLHVPMELVRARMAGQGPRFRSVVVKADATEADVAAVEARRLEFPEAAVDVVPMRSYPLGPGAAHSLGRVGEITDRQLQSALFEGIDPGIMVGQAGIEYQHNRLLMGTNGLRRVVVNSRGVEVAEQEMVPPVDGPMVHLTIDLDVQAAMEEAMRGLSGSVVALDPDTGEVLGLVSNPAYDPNVFATGIEATAWSGLIRDPETPLVNRVIQGQYPAGSTFKIVTALAALQEGVIGPGTTYFCPGYLNVYGTMRRCHKAGGHGWVDLRQAIAGSCNVYFYHVGVKLEIDRIARYANLLGLGRPSGIDLPNEVGGLIPSTEWKRRTQKAVWYPGETVSVAIGQGQVLVTPMQMARLAAAIANGGRLVKPHLLKSVRGVPEASPSIERVDLNIKPSVLEAIKNGMIAVVEEGTGRRTKLAGVTIGGKTGSSQVVTHARLERDKNVHELQPHGWFVCFAPAENPKIAMAVLVEHGRSGSESAVPVAAKILSRVFKVPLPGAVPPTVPEEPPIPMEARTPQHARIVVQPPD